MGSFRSAAAKFEARAEKFDEGVDGTDVIGTTASVPNRLPEPAKGTAGGAG